MTRAITPRRTRQRPTAVRQALSLREADLARLTWDRSGPLKRDPGIHRGQRRGGALTAREALRAVGVPPRIAALLRRRLRPTPEPEDAP